MESKSREVKKSWLPGKMALLTFLSLFLSVFVGEKLEAVSLYGARGEMSKYTGLSYTHNSVFDREIRFNGIDVSHWDGDIDWKRVKEDGIDFAIIRVGHREAGDGSITEDRKYQKNIKEATEVGIKVGVYIYSQAITKEEALEEADYVLSRISDYYISLPVVIDYEYGYVKDANGQELPGRLLNANLSKGVATEICNAFCAKVKSAGYVPMVYANQYMLSEKLNAEDISSNYKIWVARWYENTQYDGKYEYWQYTDNGRVDGINGPVDCDFWYSDSNHVYNGVDYAPVFDAEYYLTHYTDIRRAFGNDEVKAFQHFLNYGMKEGRSGNSSFDVYSYKGRYLDLQRAFGSDTKNYYLHYLKYGLKEKRNGSLNSTSYTVTFDCGGGIIKTQKVLFGHVANLPAVSKSGGKLKGWRGDYSCVTSDRIITADWSFIYQGTDYASVYDVDYYMGKYGDLRNAFGDNGVAALQHFVNYGMKEGRQAKQSFNVISYKNHYPDLRRAFGTDLRNYYLHYIQYGEKEKRSATGFEHMIVGAETVYNKVDYSAVYDGNFYVSKYMDLYRAFGYDDKALLQHFVNYGMKEGRQAKESFRVYVYKSRYKDLQRAFGNDLKSYYLHYINYGIKEGRIAQ